MILCLFSIRLNRIPLIHPFSIDTPNIAGQPDFERGRCQIADPGELS